jgi:phosphoribosylformylglycinamidine synthase subunit PurL
MAVRSETGFDVEVDDGHAGLFSEAPSRLIACVSPAAVAEVTERAAGAGVAVRRLGAAGGDRLVVRGLLDVPVAEAVAAWHGNLPARLQLIDI